MDLNFCCKFSAASNKLSKTGAQLPELKNSIKLKCFKLFQLVALSLNVTLTDFKFKQINFEEFTVNGYTILKTIKQLILK